MMAIPCVRCNKTTSSPFNFLLNCLQCSISWHHRCHNPPVPDKELIEIVKRCNAESKLNPSAKLVWKCGACIKGTRSAVPSTRHLPAASQIEPIVIDDDSDVVCLDNNSKPAPFQRSSKQPAPPRQKTATVRPSDNVPAIPPPVRQTSFVSPTPPRDPQRSPAKSIPAGAPNTGIRIIDDPFIDVTITRPQKQPPSGLVSGLIDLSMSTDDDRDSPINQEPTHMDDDDYGLEYLTPPPAPLAPLPPVDPDYGLEYVTPPRPPPVPLPPAGSNRSRVEQTARPRASEKPILLPAWINEQRAAADAVPDIWLRAARRRQIPALQTSLTDQAQLLSRRKKFKPQCLIPTGENGREKILSQTPHFFSAHVWMQQKMER